MIVRLFHRFRNLMVRVGMFVSRTAEPSQATTTFALLRPKAFAGFLRRAGSSGDGGYLLPNDLGEIAAVFSPGTAEEVSFELEFAGRGIPCHMIDGSVSGPPLNHPQFNFQRLWLGASTNKEHGTISLDDWVNESGAVGDLVLQMDIEGSEYEALLAASDATLRRFRVMILELHDLTALASPSGQRIVETLLRKIRRSHFPIHLHPNNVSTPLRWAGNVIPNIAEVTFARCDSYSEQASFAQLPHPLDVRNVATRRDWVPIWSSSGL